MIEMRSELGAICIYVAAGIVGLVAPAIERRQTHWLVIGALLVLVIVAGLGTMKVSPFTFHGGDYYMESLIAMVAACVALGGYALAWAAAFVCACACNAGEKTP